MDIPVFVAAPVRDLDKSKAEVSIQAPVSIHLNLEELKYFEVVDHQFEHCGVTFSNAIAINPSNPAFQGHSEAIVLMAAPKNGFLEATFAYPVQSVSGYVISSRRAVLSAYDNEGNQIAQAELSGPHVTDVNSFISTNPKLSVRATNIHRVTFYAFDGQLTVSQLSFSL